MIYNIPFIDELYYKYDSEIIQYEKEYNVVAVYYYLNELLYIPFIEYLLSDELSFFYLTNEPQFTSPNNLDAFKICAEHRINIPCRYQGYIVNNNMIYVFCRLRNIKNIENYKTITAIDILHHHHYFNKPINKLVINFFQLYKEDIKIYNIISKEYINDNINIIYTYIEDNESNSNYITNYKSMFLINKKPVLRLNDYTRKNTIGILLRNISTRPNIITSYNQLLSYM